MAKKKVVFIVLACVIAFSGILWAILGTLKPKFNAGITVTPQGYTVSGNGTAAVQVDDYLYFVGGFTTLNTIEYGDNEYFANGKLPEQGIYRAHLVNGVPDLDYTRNKTYLDENGEEQAYTYLDADGNEQVYAEKTAEYEAFANICGVADWDKVGRDSGIQCVVPKIAGFEQTAMWVYGQTLVYVTPSNLYDSVGKPYRDHFEFYRVNLDGSHHEMIYQTTETGLTTADYTVWADDVQNIYLLIKDGTTLYKVNVLDGKKTQLAEEVTNFLFPRVSHYSLKINSESEKLSDVFAGVMSYVYYTTARESGDGNLMYRVPVAGKAEPEQIAGQGSKLEFVPVALVDGQDDGGWFIFSTKNTQSSILKYAAARENSDLNQLIKNAEGFGNQEVAFYDAGWCLIGGSELGQYKPQNDGSIKLPRRNLASDLTGVYTVMDGCLYAQSGSGLQIYSAEDASSLPNAVSGVDADSHVSILRSAADDGSYLHSEPAVVVFGANDIILYSRCGINDKYYLRLKPAAAEE